MSKREHFNPLPWPCSCAWLVCPPSYGLMARVCCWPKTHGSKLFFLDAKSYFLAPFLLFCIKKRFRAKTKDFALKKDSVPKKNSALKKGSALTKASDFGLRMQRVSMHLPCAEALIPIRRQCLTCMPGPFQRFRGKHDSPNQTAAAEAWGGAGACAPCAEGAAALSWHGRQPPEKPQPHPPSPVHAVPDKPTCGACSAAPKRGGPAGRPCLVLCTALSVL